MEQSKIAKRLYHDQFKNDIIGIMGINKKSIYNEMQENYFPYINLIVNSTADENMDEVVFDFYELGTVKFYFNFSASSQNGLNKIWISNIKHIETKVVDEVNDTEKIKKAIIEKMFRSRILHTVCMKSMIQHVIKSKMFPYADLTMTNQSDELSSVSFKLGEFEPLLFDFKFEPRNGHNYLLSRIS